MRSPLPFPCVPDRPSKILLVQVGTLSSPTPCLVSSPIPRGLGGRFLSSSGLAGFLPGCLLIDVYV